MLKEKNILEEILDRHDRDIKNLTRINEMQLKFILTGRL